MRRFDRGKESYVFRKPRPRACPVVRRARRRLQHPTAVQAAAIPQALAGHDLMVSSQTGSGKTAAFMLPALHRIAQMPANKGVGVQVLVLTPTRELALQVTDATATYGRSWPTCAPPRSWAACLTARN